MKIGAYIRLFGRPGSDPPPPSWTAIREQALAAEAAGFDVVVLEDAALYPDDAGDVGVWEAMTMAAAIAAATTRIEIGHAVINNPYRHPTLVARCAVTIDEISGGRYRLGIGLGNTPDDYPRLGIDADHRYSRFAEAIELIRGLLREGRASLDGDHYRVPDAELVLRGPRPSGIPIIVAAGKPKMIRLAANTPTSGTGGSAPTTLMAWGGLGPCRARSMRPAERSAATRRRFDVRLTSSRSLRRTDPTRQRRWRPAYSRMGGHSRRSGATCARCPVRPEPMRWL